MKGAHYGSALGLPLSSRRDDAYDYGAGASVKASQFQNRRRVVWNGSALWLSYLLPLAIFVAVLAASSLPLRRHGDFIDPWSVSCLVCVLALCVIFVCGYYAFVSWREARSPISGTHADPTWHTFLFATGLLAWVAGIVVGVGNSSLNFKPYYDIANLNSYDQVDVASRSGVQLMDAGIMSFAPGTHLDLSKSMGFKSGDMYCVAPLAPGLSADGLVQKLPRYDIWAVGRGCCTEHRADFHCGEFANKHVLSALRFMDEEKAHMFHLAVEQAQTTHSMGRSTHPIFVTWMEDPNAEVQAYKEDGFRVMKIAIYIYIVFQLLVVAGAMFAVNKAFSGAD